MTSPAPRYHGYCFPPEIISQPCGSTIASGSASAMWRIFVPSAGSPSPTRRSGSGARPSDPTTRGGCGRAAARFFRKLLKGQGRGPRRLITDKLRSYAATHCTVMPAHAQHPTIREQPRRSLTPTNPSARTPDARVRVRQTRAAPPVGARHRVESVSGWATPAACNPPWSPARPCVHHLAGGDLCLNRWTR